MGGRENGMGRGRSVYKQPGTRVDEDRTTQEEGFQVSKRDSGKRGVDKGKAKGIGKGNSQGVVHGLVSSICVYVS